MPPTRCSVLPESRSCASTASVSRKLSRSIDAFIAASTSLHILAPSVIYLEKHRLQSRAHLWNLLRQQHSRSLHVLSAAQECSQIISGGCIVGRVCASTAHEELAHLECLVASRARLWRCPAIPASALAPKPAIPYPFPFPLTRKNKVEPTQGEKGTKLYAQKHRA